LHCVFSTTPQSYGFLADFPILQCRKGGFVAC
jgi:hypothetical protein